MRYPSSSTTPSRLPYPLQNGPLYHAAILTPLCPHSQPVLTPRELCPPPLLVLVLGTNDVAALRTIAEHVQEVVGAAGQETQQEVRRCRGTRALGWVLTTQESAVLDECGIVPVLGTACLNVPLCASRLSCASIRPFQVVSTHDVFSVLHAHGSLQVSAPPALNLDTAQDAAGEVLRLAGAAADEVAGLLAAAVAGRTAHGLGAAAAGDAAAEEQAAAGGVGGWS